MTWWDLLAALQLEIRQRTMSTFNDEPGPKGVVVTGCPKMSEEVSDDPAIR